jgi:hypothetical protein
MDAFTDPEIEMLVFVKSARVGGTEAINNMLLYLSGRKCRQRGVKGENFGIHREITPFVVSHSSWRLEDRNDARGGRLSALYGLGVVAADAYSTNDQECVRR